MQFPQFCFEHKKIMERIVSGSTDTTVSLSSFSFVIIFLGLIIDFKWCCMGGLNSRPLPYQGSALPLSYYSNCLRVIRRESSATQVKTRRVFFDDVSRRHDAETQSFWNRIWR